MVTPHFPGGPLEDSQGPQGVLGPHFEDRWSKADTLKVGSSAKEELI